MGIARRLLILLGTFCAALTPPLGDIDSASAEPIETEVPVPCTADFCNVTYKTFGGNSTPIKLDVYKPTGTNLPAVLLIHGGGWKSGDKLGEKQVVQAGFFESKGLVVFAINYRLTCDPANPPPSVGDSALCLGTGHGTAGTVTEPVDDAKDALLFVRNNASTYGVDQTKVGAFGTSAGGNLAAMVGVQGADGQGRADVVVTWSGAMHMEVPTKGESVPDASRERAVGCPYSGSGSCPSAWNDYSPFHNCCQPGNISAGTPILMFNSVDELVTREEPDQMYDLLAGSLIPVTRVIMSGTKHADGYRLDIVTTSGCEPNCDTVDTANDPNVPTIIGKDVQTATADYFLAHL